MMPDAEWAKCRDKIFDLLPEIFRGTGWAPPEEKAGIAVDVVVMIGWVHGDGSDAISYFRTGTSWASKGLVRDCYKSMAAVDEDNDEANEEGAP